MASSLQDFYEIKPEDVEIQTETLTVQGVNGKEYDVEVKALPFQVFSKIKMASTFGYETATGNQQIAQIEELTFCLKLCARGIVNPPLNDARLRSIHHTHNPEQLVTSLFKPQSIIALGSKIAQLSLDSEDVTTDENGNIVVDSGVDEKLLEEAKN